MPNPLPALRNIYQVALRQQPTIIEQYYQAVLENIAPSIENEYSKFYENNMNTTIELNLMPAFGGFMLPADGLSVVLTYDYINRHVQICYVPNMVDFENMIGEYESEIREFDINNPEALEYEGIKSWKTRDFVESVIKKLYEHNLISLEGDIPDKYKPQQLGNDIGLS